MSQDSDCDRVTILFEVEDEDGGVEIESLWALPTPRGYKLDNIPFAAMEVAWNDVVSAQPDADGLLRFVSLVEASGHTTLRLWFADEGDVEQVRDQLGKMGCSSELDLGRLLAVDVPPLVPYDAVRAFLDEQEQSGVLEYEEACLGQVS